MTHEPSITDETMPIGDNFAVSEKQAAVDGRKCITNYDRHFDQYQKNVRAMHEDILGFGRVLIQGKSLFPDDIDFGEWIVRRKLNAGRLGSEQPERSACILITRLHDEGNEEDPSGSRLTLADCKLTTPTNILKWARKTQRHLFPHLKKASSKPFRKPALTAAEKTATSTPTACNFCGREATRVKTLLFGLMDKPPAAICDDCTAAAVKLVAERAKPTGGPRTFEDLREARTVTAKLPVAASLTTSSHPVTWRNLGPDPIDGRDSHAVTVGDDTFVLEPGLRHRKVVYNVIKNGLKCGSELTLEAAKAFAVECIGVAKPKRKRPAASSR